MNAPVGVVKAQDENTKKEILQKVNSVIPEKKLQSLLKGTYTILFSLLTIFSLEFFFLFYLIQLAVGKPGYGSPDGK